MLGDGRLHLSGIAKLAPHLTRRNREKLLERATHQTKRQIETLLAEVAPRPDVPTVMRKLPEPKAAEKVTPVLQLRPNEVAALPVELRPDGAAAPGLELRPGGVVLSPVPVRPAVVEPLSPGRYKLELTVSAELHAKLERLQALMRPTVPGGDLARIVDVAVTEKLERLEARRFGKAKTPRKGLEETDTSPSSRHIPAAVKRAVYERDGGQCRFVDAHGRRCIERDRLEFHHLQPWGRDGDHSPENLQLACFVHNQHLAERDYGKGVMQRYRRSRDCVSEPRAVYA